MARIRDAAWHHLPGGFRILVPKCLPYFRAGNAAPMLATKVLVLTQRSRTAFDLETEAGGRELDSQVELFRANLPYRLLKGAERNLILLVSCRCKPNKKPLRTCHGDTEHHLA